MILVTTTISCNINDMIEVINLYCAKKLLPEGT
jgi:hypothetical protein